MDVRSALTRLERRLSDDQDDSVVRRIVRLKDGDPEPEAEPGTLYLRTRVVRPACQDRTDSECL